MPRPGRWRRAWLWVRLALALDREARPEELALAADNRTLREQLHYRSEEVYLLKLDIAHLAAALDAEKASTAHLAALHQADRLRVAADRAAYNRAIAEAVNGAARAGGAPPAG